MYHVYILLNKARTRTYTGVAADVEERLKEQNNGKVPSVAHTGRLFVRLINNIALLVAGHLIFPHLDF